MILTGTIVSFKAHCRAPFGAYVHAHEENNPSNKIDTARTSGCISLGPCGNLQGGYKFFSLVSGRMIIRCSFTEIPMPAEVIDRINMFTTKEKQGHELIFHNRSKQLYYEDDGIEFIPEPDITGVDYYIDELHERIEPDEQNQDDETTEADVRIP